MAQMTLRHLVLAILVCFAPDVAVAQTAAEVTASRAEAAEQWDEAVRAHRVVVAADPQRSDVWVRIADIEARRGNLSASVEALALAVAATPESAALYARLSQAYASAGFGPAALHAINGALALEPREPAYLRARATLATWTGDYRGAQDSYQQLEVLYPDDLDIALAFARVSAWSGDTDQAVKEYKRYLRATPSNTPVWLELAKAESWRGNYAGAVQALDAYRARDGETEAYRAELASVFASGGRPTTAEGLLSSLLAKSPADYDLNLTHAIALARQQRPRAAFESLDTVRRLSPEGAETRSAERVLRTLLSSSAESPFTAYADSDNLQVQRMAPRATIALNSGAQFSAGYERSRLDARSGSGLDGLDGSTATQYEHTWVGAAQRFGRIALNGQAGYAKGADHVSTTFGVGFDARPADSFAFSLSHTARPFVVSPRTVDLGLTATAQHAELEWTPTLRYHVVFDASVQQLSDGNRRWEVTVSPRRAIARRAGFNLDLGVTAYRMSTARDLDHGYYDPRRYEYYAATMYPYLKVRENIGLALTLAVGAQRDSSWPSYRIGGNASGEATFGIYRPWVLKVSGSATLNGRLDSGAFRGFGAGAALVRRF
jgi:cytochrome c-type biogenesis protein CcmH/NrfG